MAQHPPSDDARVPDQYDDAIKELKAFIRVMQRMEPGSTSGSKIRRFDTERRRLHTAVRRLGEARGKTTAEIFADIILFDHTLASYGLPEFVWVRPEEIMQGDFIGDHQETADDAATTVQGVDGVPVVRSLRAGKVAILFNRQIHRTIPTVNEFLSESFDEHADNGGYVSMEAKGDRERERRAARLSLKTGAPVLMINMFSHGHTVDIVGVVIDEASIDVVTQEIRDHRDVYGIREEDLDAEVVKSDWETYQRGVQRLSPNRQLVYEHLHRKMHDRSYRVSDRDFLLEHCGVDHGDVPSYRDDPGVYRREDGKRQQQPRPRKRRNSL